MSGRFLGARLLHSSTSTIHISLDCKLNEKLSESSRNNSIVLGTRSFSGRSFRSERGQGNESLSRERKASITRDFKPSSNGSSNRRGTQSKRVVRSTHSFQVQRALSHVEMKDKESAYQAWLGYYNSVKAIGGNKSRLVELANEFSRSMGLDQPPAISKLILGKMGLKNVPGLRTK